MAIAISQSQYRNIARALNYTSHALSCTSHALYCTSHAIDYTSHALELARPRHLYTGSTGKVYLTQRPQRHPVTSTAALPTATAGAGAGAKPAAKIQFDFASAPALSASAQKTLDERKAAIEEAFVHSYNGYKKYAWGHDEVGPISGTYRTAFGGWGATLVDGLDTLWLLGMKEEFDDAVKTVLEIDFTTNSQETLNVFETTIRYLGGFLSAYDLSDGRYPELLAKARDLADVLLIAFDTPNRMPITRWVWRQTAMGVAMDASDNTLLAEFGSLTLEFTRLAQLTGEDKYYDAVHRLSSELYKAQLETRLPGLWPTLVNAREIRFDYNHFTLGGMADSTYEYLPKEYLLLNGREPMYREMYINAIETASAYLFFRPLLPGNPDILFSGNTALTGDDRKARLDPQGQHLGCFIPGMVAMGSRIFSRPADLQVARRLLDGCLWAYDATPSGLMPETFHLIPCHRGISPAGEGQCDWSDDVWYTAVSDRQEKTADTAEMEPVERGRLLVEEKLILPGFVDHGDNRYILRPEAIESVFILYRVTGDRKYQDIAWKMWQAIDRAAKTDIAYAALSDVRLATPPKADRMESFWLAETLKYFYLIFADTSVLSLDEWVLNTEAHPLKRPR
ncbi:hypothetical protein DV737_g5519, partial [Chaetothyriales sp. CBS 132003]